MWATADAIACCSVSELREKLTLATPHELPAVA
jgi:hypothetical protein